MKKQCTQLTHKAMNISRPQASSRHVVTTPWSSMFQNSGQGMLRRKHHMMN